ncbi:Mu transposase C-terminal domain-containing protein [Phorcysia thermohydrogeniphila]|uniref:Mu transposase C-terminal domain-containing protein n=1 Tax=Phorcysia thermohydrogeniphila TaxID=936138 RepID=UPI001401E487|nr:Mu transposase C-terminal domain-containing protein [Phorcysia thermohydrogeniphila]
MVDLSTVEVTDLETGETLIVPISQLDSISTDEKPYHPIDPDSPDSKYLELARFRYEVIKPLLVPSRTKKQVEERAKEFNLNPATLYRWIKQFEESGGQLSALVPNYGRRGGKGKKRVNPEVEKLIKEVIETVYLNPYKRVSVKRAYQILLLKCRELGLTPPHINTFRNRIKELSPFMTTQKRKGKVVAQSLYGAASSSFEPERPLEVVQIDHTLLDVVVVDELTREPIGRPYLTIALDVYSRTVFGYYLSLDAPSYFSVAQTLFVGITPKDNLLEELGVEGKWEVWGIPEKIHVDNAKEFRSTYLEDFCKEYGITIDYRPSKTPHYGGHVERLFRTINEEIHNLPGTTFSNPVEKKGYDPERHACMTLLELEKWLVEFIVNYYHKRIHSETGTTPEEKYKEGILGNETSKGRGLFKLITGEEAKKLWFSLLPSARRTIQKDGVHLFGLRYYDNVLKPFIRLRKQGEKSETYTFKYDPRDMRYVYFQHPQTKEYYKIPCRETRLPKLSLWELKEYRKRLNLKRKAKEYELLEGLKKLITLEEEALEKTKRVKRKRNSKKLYDFKSYVEQKTSSDESKKEANEEKTRQLPPRTPQFDDLDDIEPFEVD